MKLRAPYRRLSHSGRPWRTIARLYVESLECRTTPSLTPWPTLNNPLVEVEGNDTADAAHDLGLLGAAQRGEAVGSLANADVDWYKFSLDRASRVVLTTLNELAGTSLVSALSLFKEDLASWNDPHNPTGLRMLAQADAAEQQQQDVQVSRELPAGTYYVAMSGSGNRDFHPFLADSGQLGSAGDYGFFISVEDLNLDPLDGPAVVSLEPHAGTVQGYSPLVLRVSFQEALDVATLPVDLEFEDWVQLRYHPAGTFGDGSESVVPLAALEFSDSVNELRLTPRTALAPGYYEITLGGDSLTRPMVLRDLSGIPLGATAAVPDGADFVATFQVEGSEGIPGATPAAEDTMDTAHTLGALSVNQLIRRQGAIGDDSAYDPMSADPLLANPGADVDFYAFQISGTGSYVLFAEVWAGRVGSPLDAAVSLYRREAAGTPPTLLAVSDSNFNSTRDTTGMIPLFSDPGLFRSLTAGDYFVVVSASGNLPDEGAFGVFDPSVSHSGEAGYSTGRYVLSLGLRQDMAAPEVLEVSPAADEVLAGPPTHLVVRFSEFMNLFDLAAVTYTQTSQSTVSAVWVEAADGTRYFPRLESYNAATDEATFLMLDGLIAGSYTLHLAGSLGLTDIAGNPLTGSDPHDPTGDYVSTFQVAGPERSFDAQGRLTFASQESNDAAAQAQNLGVLFPHEIQTGVLVQRDYTADPSNAPADQIDYYRFEVIQGQTYVFVFSNHTLPPGTQPRLENAEGVSILLSSLGSAVGGGAFLSPGAYTLRIGGWATADAAATRYNLTIRLQGVMDNPPPVATGVLSASRFRMVTEAPPAPSQSLPPVQQSSQEAEAPPPAAVLEQPSLPPPTVLEQPSLPPPAQPADVPSPVPVQQQTPPPANPGPLEANPSVLPTSPVASPVEVVPLNQRSGDQPNMQATPPAGALTSGNSFVPLGPSTTPLGPLGFAPAPESTAAAPSVLLVVTLVTPTIPDVVLPPVSTQTLTVSVQPPEGAVVPALLGSLRAGPVGGVQESGNREPTSGIALFQPSSPPSTTEVLVRTSSTPSSDATTVLAAAPATPTPQPVHPTAAEVRVWQQALDQLFSMPAENTGTNVSTPEMLLLQYQQLQQLWNEAFQALFGTTSTGTEVFAPQSEELAPEEDFAVSILAEDTWSQGLTAAGAALIAFGIHREPGTAPPRGRRKEEKVA